MSYVHPDSLVSTEWLAQHLEAPDVRIVDATFFMPAQNRNAESEFMERHIPGAVFFDVDKIADATTDLPHMLPDPVQFSSHMRKLGIGDGNRVVVYDANGMAQAASRAWWMLRVFGHDDVAVLNGGLPKWLRENRPLEDGTPQLRHRHFTPRINTTLVRSLAQVQANLSAKREQIVDARSKGRFTGSEPEPRPSKHSGRIPGSFNVPVSELVDPNKGELLSADHIRQRFKTAGVDLTRPIVTSCGSGVTACFLALALHMIGRSDAAVYDGSWAEWGNLDIAPVEKGP